MGGYSISRVLASKSSKAKEGELVFGDVGWTEVAIMGEEEFDTIDVPKGTKITDALGATGEMIHSPPSPSTPEVHNTIYL